MKALALSRPCPGAGMIMILSAVFLPLWLLVANAHLSHWEGGHLPNAYQMLVVPYGLKGWTILMGCLFAGATAYWADQKPEWMPVWAVFTRHGMILLGAFLVVLPGLVWIVRLGDLSILDTASDWGRVCVPLLATILVSTLAGLKVNGQTGTMLGGCVFISLVMLGV